MRIEHLDIDDTLAATVDRLWPDATWSEVIEYALALAVDDALTADRDVSPMGNTDQHEQLGGVQHEQLGGVQHLHHDGIDVHGDDLEQRMAAAFSEPR